MTPTFSEYVKQGLAEGLTRAAAERRARDQIFEEAEDARPHMEELRTPGPLAPVENLWPPKPKADRQAGDSRRPHDDRPSAAVVATPFTSVDELWVQLQRAWEVKDADGGGRVELVDVLEEINDLLDRGVITTEQFRGLLTRGKEWHGITMAAEKPKQRPRVGGAGRAGANLNVPGASGRGSGR